MSRNIAASVRQKLLNLANAQQEDSPQRAQVQPKTWQNIFS
jgi:hypothetical protein